MSSYALVNLVACVGLLALTFLVVFRRTRSPLSLPLALLGTDLFLWSFFRLGFELSGAWMWRRLDMASAALASAFGFHFVVIYVGRARSLRVLIALVYTLFTAVGLISLSALFFSPVEQWLGEQRWSLMHASALLPTAVLATLVLGIHFFRTASAQERARTRWMLTAVLVMGAFGGTELLADLEFDSPRLAPLGTLASTAILAVITLRLRLFEKQVTLVNALYALALATLAVWAYLFVFRVLGTKPAMLIVGTSAVTLLVVDVSRRVLAKVTLRRARVERLATLGRFASQMAHDLKNPLAALKGAAQFLKEEHALGHSLDDKGDFLDLVLDQIDRMHRVVDNYQRLGRVEPLKAVLDVNELVSHVLALQHFAPTTKVEVRRVLGDDAPKCNLDKDLIAGALENIIRNAFEAMANGGTLTVRTLRNLPTEPEGVRLYVEDTGAGMDARTRERAFDDFYTTKPKGSGLGLAFVRRVVEAHGGEVVVSSKEGRGSVVELRLPAN
ncbi:MAG: two-component system sensor histidine kinase NtrB [Myxococcaceae bacterium]